jgi:hypothetical protein
LDTISAQRYFACTSLYGSSLRLKSLPDSDISGKNGPQHFSTESAKSRHRVEQCAADHLTDELDSFE